MKLRAPLLAIAMLLPVVSAAEPGVEKIPPNPPTGWTGAIAVFLGEGDPHGTSVDGYLELGRRLNADVAVVAVGLGEASVSSVYLRDVISGGLGLRIIGDRLGGLAAPIELTVGGGVSTLLKGSTEIGSGPYALAFVDAVFPLTAHIRIHWNLFEHANSAGAFLTAGFGLGLTFE